MDQTNHYVVVKGLSKHFGASKVFEDLSFAIEEGVIPIVCRAVFPTVENRFMNPMKILSAKH